MERFVCKQCGDCCKNFSIQLSEEAKDEKIIFYLEDKVSMVLWEWEKNELIKEAETRDIYFAAKPVSFFFDKISNTPVLLSWTMSHDSCPFLSDGKCSIYDKRPFVCRMFPLVKSGLFDFVFGKEVLLPKSICENDKIKELLEGRMDISEYAKRMRNYYGETFTNAVQYDMINFHFANLIKNLSEKNIIKPIISPKHLALLRYKENTVMTFFEFLIGAGVETEENIQGKIELFKSLKEADEFIQKFVS